MNGDWRSEWKQANKEMEEQTIMLMLLKNGKNMEQLTRMCENLNCAYDMIKFNSIEFVRRWHHVHTGMFENDVYSELF